jgi:phenol 2-monooxygenase (NADPH)
MPLLKTVSTMIRKRLLSNNVPRQYEFERRKFAQALIAFDKEYANLFSEKPQTADNPTGVSQEVFQR